MQCMRIKSERSSNLYGPEPPLKQKTQEFLCKRLTTIYNIAVTRYPGVLPLIQCAAIDAYALLLMLHGAD